MFLYLSYYECLYNVFCVGTFNCTAVVYFSKREFEENGNKKGRFRPPGKEASSCICVLQLSKCRLHKRKSKIGEANERVNMPRNLATEVQVLFLPPLSS